MSSPAPLHPAGDPGRPVVGYTTGVYDMFHIGHLNIFSNASLHCDTLVVGVTTDELTESRKGKRPLIPFEERCEIVRSIRFVDRVVPQASMDKIEALEQIGFDVVFVGDDWRGTPTWNRIEADFAEHGVRVHYFPYTPHTSSTSLRSKVLKA